MLTACKVVYIQEEAVVADTFIATLCVCAVGVVHAHHCTTSTFINI